MGLIPGPFGAYYAASKHAIEGYSKSLDHEVRPFGIRVSVIEPWATKTAIEANSPKGDRPVPAYAQTLARYRTAFDAAMAAGDTPEDVAATIVAAAQDRRAPGRATPLARRRVRRPLPGVSCRVALFDRSATQAIQHSLRENHDQHFPNLTAISTPPIASSPSVEPGFAYRELGPARRCAAGASEPLGRGAGQLRPAHRRRPVPPRIT